MGTRSSHPVIPPIGAPRASNDQGIVDFMRQVAESMEVLRKQNEDLNTRLTVAEARSSLKEREREERCEKKKVRECSREGSE